MKIQGLKIGVAAGRFRNSRVLRELAFRVVGEKER